MSKFSHNPGQSYEPLRRILSSKKLEEIHDKIVVKYDNVSINWEQETIHKSDLEESKWKPQILVAIDGDYSKTQIETGFPGSEVGYITVSTVLIMLEKMRSLESNDFIDPKLLRDTEDSSSIDSLFLGCNTVIKGEKTPVASMRKMLFEELKRHSVFTGVETLLETYEVLLKIRREHSRSSRAPKCPYDDCDADMKEGYGEYYCDSCGGKLYSTDALRLHELLNPIGSNGEMYGQIKETMKKLQLIHLIRTLEKQDESYLLFRDIVFFIEGPLAVFSSSSWLAKSIKIELERINSKVKETCKQDLLILGIERNGNFVRHFSDIDTKKDGTGDNFPKQSVFLPDNNYICQNIVFNENPEFIYLKDTSFGRKFFYKTSAGYRIVPSIATFNNYQSNVDTAFPEQFPRLSDCLTLLDDIVSSRYENTVMPLASAHAEAAIPINVGKRIFEDIAEKIRGNN